MSVHLQSFPMGVDVDEEILEQMARVREVINEGLRLRMYADDQEAQVKVRQPLQKLVYAGTELPEWGVEIVKDEVNVKEIERGEEAWIDKEISEELAMEGFCQGASKSGTEQERKKLDYKLMTELNLA